MDFGDFYCLCVWAILGIFLILDEAKHTSADSAHNNFLDLGRIGG